MPFISTFQKSTYTSPCLHSFRKSSQAAYYFVTDSTFEQNTLTWALLSWAHSHLVKLILKEKAFEVGATPGQSFSKDNLGLSSRLVSAERIKTNAF